MVPIVYLARGVSDGSKAQAGLDCRVKNVEALCYDLSG